MRHETSALKDLTAGFLALMLAACGSGLNSTPASSGSGGSGGATPKIVIGSGSSASFAAGALNIGTTSLSAGGSTTVTATLVDTNNANTLFTTDTPVTFTSTCASSNLATLTTPVQTGTSGTAVSTYVAKGCSGTDTISASAVVNSVAITATATPTDMALKGMGGAGQQETSTVVFQVKDTSGGIAVGKTVTFSLSTSVGGVTFAPASAKSDANGNVQTVIQSGTVPTPVVVDASINTSSGTIHTQSGQLTIHSGVAAQNSFSLSGTLNVESFNIDGQTDVITVRLADRFGNHVPDGTPVTFVDSGPGGGGAMDPACTTVNGACTATWTSQNPRPAASALSKVGHAYVLAYVVGEESFRDNNGDGVFDAADGFPTADNKGEIFADSNENGSYDVGETFFDFDKSNNYTAADGKWYGINCQDPTRCGTRSLTGVGDAFCIVMSTSAANIAGPGGAVSVGTGVNLTYTIADTNGNAMAGGTTVTLIQTGVTNANVSSPGLPFTFPDIGCGGSGVSFTITVTPGSTPPPSGTLQLVVTSKSGLITSGPVVTLGP